MLNADGTIETPQERLQKIKWAQGKNNNLSNKEANNYVQQLHKEIGERRSAAKRAGDKAERQALHRALDLRAAKRNAVKEERMKRDWDQITRQNLADDLSKIAEQSQKTELKSKKASADAINSPLTQNEKDVLNSKQFKKQVIGRNAVSYDIKNPNDFFSAPIEKLSKDGVNKATHKLHDKMMRDRKLRKRIKKLNNSLTKDKTNRSQLAFEIASSVNNEDINKKLYHYDNTIEGLRFRNKENKHNSNLSREEKIELYKKNLAESNKIRHNRRVLKLADAFQEYTNNKESYRKQAADLKIDRASAGHDHMIAIKKGGSPVIAYHEDAHNLLDEIRKGTDKNKESLVNGRTGASGKIKSEIGKYIQGDSYARAKDEVHVPKINLNSSTKKDIEEDWVNRASKFNNEVVREENHASALAEKNLYLNPVSNHDTLEKSHETLKKAGKTYEQGVSGDSKINKRVYEMINANTNLSPKRLELMEKREAELAKKAIQEGKSTAGVASVIKEFRKKHGRMGGYNSPSHYIKAAAEHVRKFKR